MWGADDERARQMWIPMTPSTTWGWTFHRRRALDLGTLCLGIRGWLGAARGVESIEGAPFPLTVRGPCIDGVNARSRDTGAQNPRTTKRGMWARGRGMWGEEGQTREFLEWRAESINGWGATHGVGWPGGDRERTALAREDEDCGREDADTDAGRGRGLTT
jgi:hypothetical protein